MEAKSTNKISYERTIILNFQRVIKYKGKRKTKQAAAILIFIEIAKKTQKAFDVSGSVSLIVSNTEGGGDVQEMSAVIIKGIYWAGLLVSFHSF